MWLKILGLVCVGVFVGAALIEAKQIRKRNKDAQREDNKDAQREDNQDAQREDNQDPEHADAKIDDAPVGQERA